MGGGVQAVVLFALRVVIYRLKKWHYYLLGVPPPPPPLPPGGRLHHQSARSYV